MCGGESTWVLQDRKMSILVAKNAAVKALDTTSTQNWIGTVINPS
jgi:hypothetical protein